MSSSDEQPPVEISPPNATLPPRPPRPPGPGKAPSAGIVVSPGPGVHPRSPVGDSVSPDDPLSPVDDDNGAMDLHPGEAKAKKPKKDKKSGSSKSDKKAKKHHKKSKRKGHGDDSSSDDEFVVDDENDLVETLRRSDKEGPALAEEELSGFGSPTNNAQAALRKLASKIQQQNTVVSVLHGSTTPGSPTTGPMSGQLVKLLNRGAGFMFLSSTAFRPATLDSSDRHVHPDDADDTVEPYAAGMAGAAVPPADEPDTQRYLVQSYVVQGATYLTFAARAPEHPATVYLGAGPPPAPANPFAAQQPTDGPAPAGGQVSPAIFFSSPMKPEVHCWKVIPSEGTWFFLQPAASPGWVIDCPPPETSKAGISKSMQLRLAQFSGSPAQMFRSSTSRGVGQSSIDSGSRFDTADRDLLLHDGDDAMTTPSETMRGLADTMRQHLLSVTSDGQHDDHTSDNDGHSMVDLPDAEELSADDAATRIQCAGRQWLARRSVRDRRRAAAAHREAQASREVLDAQKDDAANEVGTALRRHALEQASKALVYSLRVAELLKAAEVVGTAATASVARRVAEQRRRAAAHRNLVLVQAAARSRLSRTQARVRADRTHLAAVSIQSVARGWFARRMFTSMQQIVEDHQTDRLDEERTEWQEYSATCERSVTLMQASLRWQLGCSESASRRHVLTENAARTLQRRCRPLAVDRGNARRRAAALQSYLDEKSVAERDADIAEERDTAVRVLQRRLWPLTSARCKRKDAALEVDCLIHQRVEAERLDYAARQIQAAGRGLIAGRAPLQKLQRSTTAASALLRRVMAGFVVRAAVADLKASVRRRFRAFPPRRPAAAVDGTGADTAASPARRHRSALLSFTEAIDGDGFQRLQQLRPPTSARRPSTWSIDSRALSRAGSSVPTTPRQDHTPKQTRERPDSASHTDDVTAEGRTVGLGASAAAQHPRDANVSQQDPPSTRARASSGVGKNPRPPSAQYPFSVPSHTRDGGGGQQQQPPRRPGFGPSAAPRPRPVSVLLRQQERDAAKVGGEQQPSSPNTAARKVDDIAELRYMRHAAATPTTATRDLAAELCSAWLRVAARDGGAAEDSTWASQAQLVPGLPPAAADARTPGDVLPHLLADSPLPTPMASRCGSFRQSPTPLARDEASPSAAGERHTPTPSSPPGRDQLPALALSPLPATYAEQSNTRPSGSASRSRASQQQQQKTTTVEQRNDPAVPRRVIRSIVAKLTPYHMLKFRSLRAVGPWTAADELGFLPAASSSSGQPQSTARQPPAQQKRVGERPPRPPSGDRSRASVGGGSARRPPSAGAKPPRAPSPQQQQQQQHGNPYDVSVAAADSAELPSLALLEQQGGGGGAVPLGPVDIFDYSTDTEALVAGTPQTVPRPVAISTMSPARAALERKIVCQQLYRKHFGLYQRYLADHKRVLEAMQKTVGFE